jgi:Flp pilus assembly protein TadD
MIRLLAPYIGKIALLVTAIMLSGCADQIGKYALTQDETTKLLDAVGGPKVEGVDGSMIAMAEAAAKRGEYAKAASVYEQLFMKDQENVAYMEALGRILRMAGRNEKAAALYREAYRREPKNIDIVEGYGLTMMAMGKKEEALQLLGDVLKQDEGRWRSLNAVGIAFAMDNKIHEALQYYNAALKVDANNPSILNNIGLIYGMAKDYDSAVTALTRASMAAPDDKKKRIDLNLSMMHALSGNMEKAEKVAAAHLSKAALYNNMGFLADISQKPELARSYINMALSKSPVHYEKAWQNLQKLSGDGV